jgi:DNA-binding NarL/FixJ family response regulator
MSITETNKQIIQHLAAGKVYKEIAKELNMKTRTVIDRVENLKKKYSCTTVTQLVIEFNKPKV